MTTYSTTYVITTVEDLLRNLTLSEIKEKVADANAPLERVTALIAVHEKAAMRLQKAHLVPPKNKAANVQLMKDALLLIKITGRLPLVPVLGRFANKIRRAWFQSPKFLALHQHELKGPLGIRPGKWSSICGVTCPRGTGMNGVCSKHPCTTVGPSGFMVDLAAPDTAICSAGHDRLNGNVQANGNVIQPLNNGEATEILVKAIDAGTARYIG